MILRDYLRIEICIFGELISIAITVVLIRLTKKFIGQTFSDSLCNTLKLTVICLTDLYIGAEPSLASVGLSIPRPQSNF